MRLRTFLLLDLLGALPWIALLVGAGYAAGDSAIGVAEALSRYALLAGLAAVLAIVVAGVLRRRAPVF
jgi:membrane protein DedA with SNARE-associated domain